MQENPVVLKHGVFLAPFHNPVENPTIGLRQDIELARIADASGVSDFFLAEDAAEMGAGEPVRNDAPMDDGPPTDGMEMQDAAPSVTVEGFRVRSRFQGDLAATARFLAGLENVERALTVREIRIREGGQRLIVEMEMEFYVSQEA